MLTDISDASVIVFNLRAIVIHRGLNNKESAVKGDECQHEMDFAPEFAHCFAEHFWKPIVDGRKDGKHTSAEKHIMNVTDDEIGIVDINIDVGSGHENAA